MRRVGFLIWKELLELKADPRLFGLVIVAPILQLFMLGYAATTDIRDVPVVVADADRSDASRDLIARFEASPNFTIVGVVTSTREIDPYLERGRAWMALAIPAGYGETLGAGRPQTVQVVADGSDANSTIVALGYATNLIAGYAQELALSRLPPGVTMRVGIEPRVRVWFNPRLESRDFMIPGVARAAAARGHDEPVVDGHRAREGARHARAAERDAAAALGADRRQAAAVRARRDDRRRAWCWRSPCSGFRFRCAAASGCCSG